MKTKLFVKMIPLKTLFIGLAVLLFAKPLIAGKVLGYVMTPSRSHFIINDALLRGLAANGHEVCMIFSSTNFINFKCSTTNI